MIHHLEDLQGGYEVEADAVVVGSGAGGAVAAVNLARAGMKVVVVEAGPQLKQSDFTRDTPMFMARYYWEGGLRLSGGSAPVPIMQGRMLGGSTVVNSAIMYKLPDYVRDYWIADEGLDNLRDDDFDAAFDVVFEKTRTQPTPMSVMGKRNLAARDAMEAAGIPSNPLPRAVVDCEGCADCIIGCERGAKQSVDRSYLPAALEDGAEVYTCSMVQRVLFEGNRAVGVAGRVLDPIARRKHGRFTVRAPRVFLAAGAVNTPQALLRSGARGVVGENLQIHLTGGMMAIMDERIDPWIGATQGWGAISQDVEGLKYECLWAPMSLLLVRWGDIGLPFLENLHEIQNATAVAIVYRSNKVTGRVSAGIGDQPLVKLWIPKDEIMVILKELKRLADGLLKTGARYVYTGYKGTKRRMTTPEDTAALTGGQIRPFDMPMTGNHIFGSCRMSADPQRGAVDPEGKVYGLEGLWVCDASLFPSGSAVNPQATVMALSEVITRRVGELSF